MTHGQANIIQDLWLSEMETGNTKQATANNIAIAD